ncbi:MAG: hypothetical protein ACLR8Y_09065 [Alistipes indistinctus]
MSENIKPSEVSDVLRMQLEGIDTDLRFDEVGTVLEVSDGVARIYGLENAEANELLEFDNGIKAVVMNLEEDNVGVVLLGPTDRIRRATPSNVRAASPRSGGRRNARPRHQPAGRDARRIRTDRRRNDRNAAPNARPRRHLPPTGEPAAANRTQGDRRDDSDRPRTARTDHRQTARPEKPRSRSTRS